MEMVITKTKNHNHVVGNNTKEEFDLNIKEHQRMAQWEIYKALSDYNTTWSEDHEEMAELENLQTGNYEINEGDFTYKISIV